MLLFERGQAIFENDLNFHFLNDSNLKVFFLLKLPIAWLHVWELNAFIEIRLIFNTE